MTIHSSHPFAGGERDEVRRFRGRLGGAVTLWTAGEGGSRAGLTVTSLMVANGEPPHVLALLDPDSDLHDVLDGSDDARCVVQLLAWRDRALAEMFAGTAPAPGGAFGHAEWEQTPYGPRLATTTAWAYVVPVDERPVGWSSLVTFRIDEVHVLDETEPGLGHRRGRFHALDA